MNLNGALQGALSSHQKHLSMNMTMQVLPELIKPTLRSLSLPKLMHRKFEIKNRHTFDTKKPSAYYGFNE